MDTLPEHIAALIREGRKVEAIKLIREETGASLADAKAAVDRLSAPATTGPIDEEEVAALAWTGRTIEAIHLVRQQTGLDLKASKEIVERMAVDPVIAAQQRRRRLVVVTFLLVLALGMLFGLVFSMG